MPKFEVQKVYTKKVRHARSDTRKAQAQHPASWMASLKLSMQSGFGIPR